jgi:hypothetical protein
MKIPSYIGIFSIATSFSSAIPAMGATASVSINVSATVEAECQVSSRAASYKTVTSAMANAPSGVSVSCDFNTPYNITVRRAAIGNMKLVTDTEPVDSATNTEQATIGNGPLLHGPAKLAVDLDRNSNYPILPIGYDNDTEARYDGVGLATDTIVLEVTY